MPTITSINVSDRKGMRKKPVQTEVVHVIAHQGIEGDAHAGDWHRQVSFLAAESIKKACEMGLDVGPGDFAENFTTEDINLLDLPIGTQLKLGSEVEVEISQIGKVCHTRCAIYHLSGDCIFPREGIFAVVLKGGDIHTGDEIVILKRGTGTCDYTPPEALAEIEAAREAGTL